jgi:hypothetical protein
MDARAEKASLNADPLPPVVILNPLYIVRMADLEIAELQERIAKLTQEKQEAMDYAIKNNVMEEDNLRLNVERSVRKSRTLNIEKFREVFPDEYQMACDVERKDLAERLGHVGEKINLTLVDKLVKKVKLEAAPGVIEVTEKESLSYSVVRKP